MPEHVDAECKTKVIETDGAAEDEIVGAAPPPAGPSDADREVALPRIRSGALSRGTPSSLSWTTTKLPPESVRAKEDDED